jgi:hypothetical protein
VLCSESDKCGAFSFSANRQICRFKPSCDDWIANDQRTAGDSDARPCFVVMRRLVVIAISSKRAPFVDASSSAVSRCEATPKDIAD